MLRSSISRTLTAVFSLIFVLFIASPLQADQGGFIGEVRMFAGNFAPRGWAFCEGQLLPISSNTALFSIIGTIYGGDGRSTFALPDLRGRAALGPGRGPGLSSHSLGSKGGAETNTLSSANLPAHTHTLKGSSGEKATSRSPGGDNVLAESWNPIYTKDLNSSANTGSSGNSQAVNNMQPFTSLHYIIAIEGVYPSRN